MPNALSYVFAGGGTGGHLYPGLAIAEQLRGLAREGGAPEPRALFICSTRPIDASILRAENAAFEPLTAAPFPVRPGGFLRFARTWPGSVSSAKAILRREMQAAGGASNLRVVAMGGFVAAPVIAAARALRLPVALVNLDAVPGKANRWIASKANLTLSATGEREKVPPAWRRISPIVRAAALPNASPADARAALGLRPDLPTLFVSGGSQGAGSINKLLARLATNSPRAFAGWQVFHQTGAADADSTRAAYASAGVVATVVPFCDRMGDAWAAADLAVARSGAGTVGEVWASATPTLFLPYPYHRDEHQKWNARPLERAGGVVIVKDLIDPAANEPAAGAALLRLLQDAAERARMRAGLKALGPADGARTAAAALAATPG